MRRPSYYIFPLLILLLSSEDLVSQTKSLPIRTTVRKSLLGGSYVLQVHSDATQVVKLWIEAKEMVYNFAVSAGATKDIGWAQGLRFDANDAFFISGDGYDTLRQAMPSDELSPWRIGFSRDGSLVINLSQSFVQSVISKQVSLPIQQGYSNILDIAVTDMPILALRDGSDRIHANLLIHTTWFKGKPKIPINTTVSFVPEYDGQNGKLFASDLEVDGMEVKLVPQEWLNDLTNAVNQILPLLLGRLELFTLDKTLFKYAKFFNVRQVAVRDGRIEIEFL